MPAWCRVPLCPHDALGRGERPDFCPWHAKNSLAFRAHWRAACAPARPAPHVPAVDAVTIDLWIAAQQGRQEP